MDGDDTPDVFRETWVRFLGYSNEVGEAFRPIVPKFVVRAAPLSSSLSPWRTSWCGCACRDRRTHLRSGTLLPILLIRL
jgi:hypothetical protein